MIHFGPEIGADLEAAERKEWLVTNGLGGYAMGTLAGTLTRGYHGLLVAALRPPLGRRLLVTKQDDVVTYQGREVTLAVNRWAADEDELLGFQHLSGFRLEGTIPVWTYVIDDALLEKRLWMRYGENSTYVHFSYIKGDSPLELSTALYLNDRDHHARTNPGDIKFRIRDLANGLEVTTSASAAHIFLLSQDMQAYAYDRWSRRFYLSLEHYRGLPDSEAHYMGGQLSGVLKPGESAAFVASTEPNPELDASKAYDEELLRQNELIHAASWLAEVAQPKDSYSPTSISGSAVKQLILAADQFVVRRQTKTQTNGRTIIAGYPWFGDWGRDTMIALPGITLSAGQHRTAANILRTFAEFIDQGMLPNRFPDEDDSPAYNTADATLWYFEALRAYLDETQDLSLIEAIFPALKEIIQWHINGTRHQIKIDPSDGLLFAGEPGVQLTWMDAKVGNWVVTPRIGKPVEINALWYNALLNMATFARLLNEEGQSYLLQAEHTKEGFGRFWNRRTRCCFDLLDGPEGDDDSVRPNQIFAVSLRHSPLTETQRRRVVDVCADHLLTPFGLRSLAADHPNYKGVYGGDVWSRDSAYHQGTVWSWLMGPFIQAHLRVYGDAEKARRMLAPLLNHLADFGLGSVSEIFDGDYPHHARGCPAQAWGAAELLRVIRIIRQGNTDRKDLLRDDVGLAASKLGSLDEETPGGEGDDAAGS